MKCLLISPLNYIGNINFFLFSFLKYLDLFFCHIDICSGHYRNFKISLCQISNLSFYLNEYRLRKNFFLSLYSFFFFFFCLFKSRTHKILAQVRDHRWSFYDNCLSIQEAQIKNQQTLTTCPWIPSVCNQTSRMLYQVSSMSKKLQFIIYHIIRLCPLHFC